MPICDAAPKQRSEELGDEEDGHQVACPQSNRGFRLTVLLVPGGVEEPWQISVAGY